MSIPVNFESLNFGNVGRDAMNFNFPRESYLVNFESDLPSLNAVSLALAPSKKQYLGIIEIRDDTAFMYQKHFEEKSYENFVQPPQINFEKSRSRRMDKPAHSNDFIDPQHYFTNPRASKSPGATRVTYENIQIQNSSRKHWDKPGSFMKQAILLPNPFSNSNQTKYQVPSIERKYSIENTKLLGEHRSTLRRNGNAISKTFPLPLSLEPKQESDSSHLNSPKLKTEDSSNTPYYIISDAHKKSIEPNKGDTFWAWDLTEAQAHLVEKVLTAKNIRFIKDLRDYPYTIKTEMGSFKEQNVYKYVWKFKGKCNKEFDRSWNLLDHCRMHYGVRPYGCYIWGRRFTQRGNRNKHVSRHK